jgi:hypothetical protein
MLEKDRRRRKMRGRVGPLHPLVGHRISKEQMKRRMESAWWSRTGADWGGSYVLLQPDHMALGVILSVEKWYIKWHEDLQEESYTFAAYQADDGGHGGPAEYTEEEFDRDLLRAVHRWERVSEDSSLPRKCIALGEVVSAFGQLWLRGRAKPNRKAMVCFIVGTLGFSGFVRFTELRHRGEE